MTALKNWAAERPVTAFVSLSFGLSWPLFVVIVFFFPKNMTVQGILGNIATFAPAVVGMAITTLFNEGPKRFRGSGRALAFLAACIISGNAFARTPVPDIHDAVRQGDLFKVKAMLAFDGDLLNARDSVGHTPLSISAAYARWEIFQYLIGAGADVNIVTKANGTPMHSACQYDRPDMIRLLLEKGAAPSMKVRDVYGEYSPMLRAVQRGCEGVVEFLLDNGADPEEATKEGWNALHLAAKCGHRHLYKLLTERGVSPEAKDKEGRAPMECEFIRPEPIVAKSDSCVDYVGRYTWKGDPDGPGVNVFLQGGRLMLDDYSLNELYAIDTDTFYCSQDPWRAEFHRGEGDAVEDVELFFLRRSVVLVRID